MEGRTGQDVPRSQAVNKPLVDTPASWCPGWKTTRRFDIIGMFLCFETSTLEPWVGWFFWDAWGLFVCLSPNHFTSPPWLAGGARKVWNQNPQELSIGCWASEWNSRFFFATLSWALCIDWPKNTKHHSIRHGGKVGPLVSKFIFESSLPGILYILPVFKSQHVFDDFPLRKWLAPWCVRVSQCTILWRHSRQNQARVGESPGRHGAVLHAKGWWRAIANNSRHVSKDFPKKIWHPTNLHDKQVMMSKQLTMS